MKINIVGQPSKPGKFPMCRPNDFLVRERFNRLLGELGEENHAVKAKAESHLSIESI